MPGTPPSSIVARTSKAPAVTPHAVTAAVTAAVTPPAPIEILSHRLAAHPDFECARKKK